MQGKLFESKVCLVTGANRGIGFSTAQAISKEGGQVILVGRNIESLVIAANKLNAESDKAVAYPFLCDVSNPLEVKNLFQNIFKQFNRLDVLVANAGVMEDALIGMVTHDLVKKVFEINTYSFLYCSQYASRLMARHGGGSIVALSSVVGLHGYPGQAVYSGSKAAIIGVVKSLSKELALHKIRVNAVAPGLIDTELIKGIPDANRDKFLERIAMKRIGKPSEVANVISFLASDLSKYITGQVICVDGGMD